MTPGEIEAVKSITKHHQPKRADGAAEVAFRQLLNSVHIPRASALLEKVHDACEKALSDEDWDGAAKMCALYYKVCGLIKAPRADAEVEQLAQSLLSRMIEEARSRQP